MRAFTLLAVGIFLNIPLQPVFGLDHTLPTLDEAGRRTSPRDVNSGWDPHQTVEKMLQQVNGPHLPQWEQRPPDAFETKMTAILNRLQTKGKDLDPAEVDMLNKWAGQLVQSQEALIKAFENIKENTKDSASEVQKANLHLLLDALETRLLRATVLKERVAKQTGKSGSESETIQAQKESFKNIFQGALLR